MTRSRTRVLDAVATLLVRGGLEAVTIEAVIATSGVARATVYRHWPSRRALVMDGLSHLIDPPPVIAPVGSIRDQLTQLFAAFADQLASEDAAATVPVLLASARRDPELAELMTTFTAQRRAPVISLLTAAIARGDLAENADAEAMCDLLIGALFFRRVVMDQPIDEAFAATVIDAVLASGRR